jgi:coiled-coil domain-containing protein 55
MLERDEQRHAEMMKALEEAKKNGQRGGGKGKGGEEEKDKEKTEDDIAKDIIKRGGKITINDDGQIVDKRELLKGGLNVGAKKKAEVQQEKSRLASGSSRDQGKIGVFVPGGKQAMRERQSRMLEQQLEESLKRAREDEEEERKKIELVSKSRKTEADISSAKERYLARKRVAEEAKKKGEADDP